MKELINNLIERSGLSNKEFAKAVGTSESYLSQMKRHKLIDVEKLTKWAKTFDFEYIESTNVKIKL